MLGGFLAMNPVPLPDLFRLPGGAGMRVPRSLAKSGFGLPDQLLIPSVLAVIR